MRRDRVVMIAGVFATSIGGCALPLWLLPDEDEFVTNGPEVGPLRDTGVRPRSDTGVDARPVYDTFRPDTGPPNCAASRSGECGPVASVAGETVCTDAMLSEILTACFAPSGSESKCSAVKENYAGCTTCVFDHWVLDVMWNSGACIRAIDPTSKCAEVVQCTHQCVYEVCADCEWSADGGGEWQKCFSAALLPDAGVLPTGECHGLAGGDYGACERDPRLRPCIIKSREDWLVFMSGACRDGGKWSVAADAGTD